NSPGGPSSARPLRGLRTNARAASAARPRPRRPARAPSRSASSVLGRRDRRRAHLVRGPQLFAFDLGGGAAEAALALLEEGERLEVVALAEVGPQGVGHVHLGVRELPEEEVAEAHLAAGADQEIGIRDAARAEVLGERAGGDPVGVELAAPDAPGAGARGARDLLAPAVADGEDHGHTGVAPGRGDGGAQRPAHRQRQAAEAADGEQADLVLHHLAELGRQVAAEERHEPVDLARRAAPVLRGEGVEREVADAEAPAGLDYRPHRFLADAMPLQTRQAAPFGPAPVAVHDDGHVTRQVSRIDLHHQTAMISSSFPLSVFSTRSMYSLVSASTFSAACRRSSSVISLSFSSSFSISSESRRWLRTDTR